MKSNKIMRTILVVMFMAMSTMSMAQKKMIYDAELKKEIYELISSNKEVQSALKKVPKEAQKDILEKFAIFYSLSKEDQKSVLNICEACAKKNGIDVKQIVSEVSSYSHEDDWTAGLAIGGAIFGGGVGGPGGAALGATLGGLLGKAIGKKIDDAKSKGKNKVESSVMANPDGTDCEGRKAEFPFQM